MAEENKLPTIQYGNHIIVEYNNRLSCHCISPNGKIKIFRNSFLSCDSLIGTLYNRTYFLDGNNSIVEIEEREFFRQLKASIISPKEPLNHDANNQFLVDKRDSSAQKATQNDITLLKSQNVSIINLLKYIVDGSRTFESKNPFSQEKYIKKKFKKHCCVFSIYKPTVNLLAETYYQNVGNKILNIRPDTLGQLLYYSEIISNSNVLLVEGCEGLIAASIYQKLAHMNYNTTTDSDNGFLFHLDASNRDIYYKIFKQLDFKSENLSKNYSKYPLNSVIPCYSQHYSHDIYAKLTSRKYHSLVVAIKDDPYEIIEKLFETLLSSSSIVVYHPYREPLCECYVKMKRQHGSYVDITMSETWFREYQIAEDRTHPLNNMDGAGGFLLRARKIEI